MCLQTSFGVGYVLFIVEMIVVHCVYSTCDIHFFYNNTAPWRWPQSVVRIWINAEFMLCAAAGGKIVCIRQLQWTRIILK